MKEGAETIACACDVDFVLIIEWSLFDFGGVLTTSAQQERL